MGKAVGGVPEPTALGDRAGSIGAYLSAQRRLRGIGLEELATLTRIPIRSLERLEAGAYDGQADGFVRGFVRTVAAAIGLDPQETVSRLLEEPAAQRRRGFPRPDRLLAAAAALALLIGLLYGAAWLRSAPPAAEPPQAGATLVRRDAVRELARSVGQLPPAGAPQPPAR